MILVWFIYGLAFFILGFGIFIYPKKGSVFRLANHIWMIAAFGILHGINEWLDMFITIGEPFDAEVLKFLRMLTLCTSFLFLVLFGSKIIAETNNQYRLIRIIPTALFAAWALVFILSGERFLAGDIAARYLLCVPGTILTALALSTQISELRTTRLRGVTRCLQIAVVAFLFYGFAAGLVVKKSEFFPANYLNYDLIMSTFGIPVQMFRTLCAIVLAFSIIYILNVFRWETQQLIRRSEERFGKIASAMPLFLFVQDINHVITFAQGNGLKLLNLEPGDIHRRHIADVFGSIPQIEEDSRRCGTGEEFSSTFRTENLVFEAYYSPMRADNNELIGVMVLAINVTAKVKSQEQLDDYRRQIEQNARLAEIGTLGSIMVDQVRQPLTIACMRLQRLLIDMDKNKTTVGVTNVETLKKCLSDVSKSMDIASGFYQTAQPRQASDAKAIDIYKIAKTITEVFAKSAQRVNLAISLKSIDCFPRLSIAEHELEQIFFSLIQNSINTADANKSQKLTISCREYDNQIELQFADTCGGIAFENMEKIFEPFIPTHKDEKKCGLELAIAKRIVCAHGGDIKAENIPGCGTAFNVTFPV
ncbi:MAG: ATP-binding protein [Phycisphaerae bacterium]|nr:ATP-binding protein [Phycisphaerae bacterium]